jgi:GTPase KRas protein
MADVDNQTCMLEITDTAGQDEYSVIRERASHRNGNGYILVYSVISRASFLEIPKYHQAVLAWKGKKSFPMVLVGNKMDLELEREVPTKDGEKLAETLQLPFFESSPKENTNIEQIFFTLVRQMRSDYKNLPAEKKKKKPKCIVM